MCMDISKEDWQTWDTLHYENGLWTNALLPGFQLVSCATVTSFGKKIYCFFGAFTILTFYLLDVLCPIQENITVYEVSSKNFDLDFDRPNYHWINQVLAF